ncbi:MAG TPA: phospholipase D-like domain-containing protein [Gammaproteobacteria bacterium]|nr:phospholipase D-like domain-containing protein [Gammaproteobacteria bacterium]
MNNGALTRTGTPPRAEVRAVFPKLVFVEGDDLYRDMLTRIGRAGSSISLETYIFHDDALGRRFVRALMERAEQGVQVRLLVDALGSMGIFSRRTEREMRRTGVEVRRFHRWQWRDPLRYNRRDHRKLLVVDGRVAYVGGFNIHAESSRLVSGTARWRDTHVRFEGALAREAQDQFDIFWHRRWKEHRALGLPANDVLISNHNAYARRRLRYFIDDLMETPAGRLWVSTPYFVPDRRMQQRLVDAAQRGADVRLLVPNKNDIRLARWAARAAYATLLQGGVRIFEYLPRMLHAKTIVADGEWVMVGTSNLDYRSFRHNYEINLVSTDPALCRQLENEFEGDLEESLEIRAGGWRDRPWIERLAEGIGWVARRWL